MKFEQFLVENSEKAPARELTGKVTLHNGEWFYRKPNNPARFGPYPSASKAAEAARAAGVRID